MSAWRGKFDGNSIQPASTPSLPPPASDARDWLMQRYLRGEGLEIGPLHAPCRVPPWVRVRYVDRCDVPTLRAYYPELNHLPLVAPDIIDDGETLQKIAPASCDFLIASHFLEHTQDPIGTLVNFLRVLKVDGVAFLVVPDKRFTFDRDRPTTDIPHLLQDYREGPACSRQAHYEEWVRYIDKIPPGEDFKLAVDKLLARSYSIHFHVWSQRELLAFFSYVQTDLQLPCAIEAFMTNDNGSELILVLRKTS